jgi:hypothetical protein
MVILMTEQNRKYVTKEIGKLLSEIWRIKGLAEQEYGLQHPSPRSSPACMRMHKRCCRKNMLDLCRTTVPPRLLKAVYSQESSPGRRP